MAQLTTEQNVYDNKNLIACLMHTICFAHGFVLSLLALSLTVRISIYPKHA